MVSKLIERDSVCQQKILASVMSTESIGSIPRCFIPQSIIQVLIRLGMTKQIFAIRSCVTARQEDLSKMAVSMITSQLWKPIFVASSFLGFKVCNLGVYFSCLYLVLLAQICLCADIVLLYQTLY